MVVMEKAIRAVKGTMEGINRRGRTESIGIGSCASWFNREVGAIGRYVGKAV
jgi:hypothetical protein